MTITATDVANMLRNNINKRLDILTHAIEETTEQGGEIDRVEVSKGFSDAICVMKVVFEETVEIPYLVQVVQGMATDFVVVCK